MLTLHYDQRSNAPEALATPAKAHKLGTGKGITDCDEIQCNTIGGDGFPQAGWGWFDADNEVDFYSFGLDTTNDECVEYRIVPPGDMDLVVTMFAPDGTEIGRLDRAGTGQPEFLKIFSSEVGQRGRYFWSVESKTGSSLDPYYLDFKKWDPDCHH